MTPIRNGVVLYVGNYNEVYRTDLYKVGNCYAFIVSPGVLVEDVGTPFEQVHCILRYIDDGLDMWRKPGEHSGDYGLLVTPTWRIEPGLLWTGDLA